MAKLPTVELTKKVTEFAVEHRGNDARATAELAFRWGYMHGQWDAREDLVK